MSSEHFNENFSVFGQIENLWMDKIADIHIKFRETELVEIS